MNKTIFSFRTFLCLLLLSACVQAPAPVQTPAISTSAPTATPRPILTAEPPLKVELDESFYSHPRRLGDATETHDLMQAPEASLISLNLIEGEYLVEVIAKPGAVPPNARVVIANMETLFFKLVTADDQGAFRAEVLGFSGAHILIKQDATGGVAAFDSAEKMANIAAGAEFIHAPGVIMQIPFEYRGDGRIPIATGFCCEHFNSPWIFEGSLSTNHVRSEERFTIEGKVTLFSDSPEPPDLAVFSVHPLFLTDEAGRQIANTREFVSAVLTSTGLAIERGGIHVLPILADVPLSWQKEGETWTAFVDAETGISGDFRDGYYILFASVLNQVQMNPQPLGMDESFQRLHPRCCYGEKLVVLEVGDPAPTHLAVTVLADVLSEGSRGGVIAQEDQGLFEFSTRTVTHHNPVIPRLDAFGTPWSYQLGPFLPMVGGGDRRFGGLLPAINFDFTSGELSIRIQRPDGQVDLIGPSPITRMGTNTPKTPWNDHLARGGGSLGEVPQLLGNGDAFAYQFPLNGDYLITLDGQIKDILGNDYEISGTYPVTLADVLDIEPALLPGTPFEVGDSMPTSLYVMPGLPAEIVYKVWTYDPTEKRS